MKASKWYTVALVVALYSCGGGATDSNTMTSAKTGININPELLAQKADPICGMDMTQTKIADTLTHNGGLYAFCNSGCKEAFKASPEEYLK
jgi:YHS domain-containing protein